MNLGFYDYSKGKLQNANTASHALYALTASYAMNGGGGGGGGDYVPNSWTGSNTSEFSGTASLSSYPIGVKNDTLYSTRPVSINTTIYTPPEYSIFLGLNAGEAATSAYSSNFIGKSAGSQSQYANSSNFFGLLAGFNAPYAYGSNFIGRFAGLEASNANLSNFIGRYAGYQASNANLSNFIGDYAGYQATTANFSNFIGSAAGIYANRAYQSNFIGSSAGNQAFSASFSNFIGSLAGAFAFNATHSIIIGTNAGYGASSASYSTLIGHFAGANLTGNSIGSNNIIIGTNITLPNGRKDSINIGGIIFGTGSYSTPQNNPNDPTASLQLSGSADGKIGINVVNPIYNLHVSGTVGFSNLTDSSTAAKIVLVDSNGQLFTTASSALSVFGGTTFPYSGSAIITGSLLVSGSSINLTGSLGINGSLTENILTGSLGAGTTTIFQRDTGSFTAALAKYTVNKSTNARAGEFMTVWNGNMIVSTDTSTTDIGSTTDLIFSASLVSGQIQTNAVAVSSGWNVKMLITYI